MQNNYNFLILLIVISLGILYFRVRKDDVENYQETLLPFNTEKYVHPFLLNRYYERQLDKDNQKQSQVYSKKVMKKFEYVDNNNNANALKKAKDIAKDIAKHYYHKFRDFKDKVAILENNLVYTQDMLNAYKKKLAFCRRELTLKPVLAKCNGKYSLEPNSITGLGVDLGLHASS